MLSVGLYVVLTSLLQVGICASGKDSANVSCNHDGELSLLYPKNVSVYIDGVVLLCEEGTWRTIHDSNWTVADRTVACRQLGYMYSDQDTVVEVLGLPYQHSRRTIQCNGSESTLLKCPVTNTTTNTDHITPVYVNCMHPSSSIETNTIPLPSETANIKLSSSVPKPSPSLSKPVIATTSKAEAATSSPAPPPSASPSQKTTFLTPLISGILGGLATLIAITVIILAIFIITTRTKRRANKRKRNSNDYSGKGTLPLYREPVYAQPSQVDATNPHIYHELERVYDAIKESPKSNQRHDKDAAAEGPNIPEPYQKPIRGQSGEGFEPKAQYASLDRSKQYATLEAFTGDTLPKTFASSGRCTSPNGTYSHLNHNAPAAHPEPTSGDPDYSEIPVRPERTHKSIAMNPVKDRETVHGQKGESEAPNDRKSAEYAVLEPCFITTQWKIDDVSTELAAECLYYKRSLNAGGQPQEADRTSSELSTCNGLADLSTPHNE